MIPRGTVCLLSGAGGAGKSILGLQLQVAAATGRDWLGLGIAPCVTLGLYTEDPEDIVHQRVHSICEHYDVEKGDLDDMRLVSREEDQIIFESDRYNSECRFTAYFQQLWDYVRSEFVRVLILDTAARLFAANENVRAHVTAFIAGLDKLARAMDGAVILNVHPSKANDGSGYSGSTAWEATVRAHLHLKRPKGYDAESAKADHDARTLRNMKGNWGPAGGVVKLRWRNGLFVPDVPEDAARPWYREDD